MLAGFEKTSYKKSPHPKSHSKNVQPKKRWNGKSRAKAMSRSTLWVLWTPDCSFQSGRSPRRAAGVTSSQKLGMETTLTSSRFSQPPKFTKTAPECLLGEPETTSRNLWKFSMFYWCMKWCINFCQRWIILKPRIHGETQELPPSKLGSLIIWSTTFSTGSPVGCTHIPWLEKNAGSHLEKNNATSCYIDWYIYIYMLIVNLSVGWYMHWYKYAL